MFKTATTTAPRMPRWWLWPLTGAGAAAIIITGVHKAATSDPVDRAQQSAAAEAASYRVAMDTFLASDALPHLALCRTEATAAVTRALTSLDTCFAHYAGGAPAFASALTSWGTRFKIIYRSGVETAERKPEHSWTAQIVQKHFTTHVVSDVRLEADVMEILKQFNYDLEASGNTLEANLTRALQRTSFPNKVRTDIMQVFRPAFQKEIHALLKSKPTQSIGIGMGSLAAGIAVEEAVRQVIRAVVAQAATRMAAGAVTAAGAGAATTAAGTAGGTVVAPGIGTTLGLAGGFIAGAAIDWWMTDKFNAKVTAQCLSFLAKTKDSLLTSPRGLKALLAGEAQRFQEAATKAAVNTLRLPPTSVYP